MKDIDWKILMVLYNTRSITKAAEALFMTQSGLTKRLKGIEDEWNVKIVERSSKGVRFTENGEYLVKKAAMMVDFQSEIEEHFASYRQEKEIVKIGVPNSFAKLHMPRLIKEYTETEGSLQIKTIPNSSDVLLKQLVDGSIDLAVICGDYPYMGDSIYLFDEQMYAVTPVGVTLEELDKLPYVKSALNPMVKMLVDQWWKQRFGSIPHETYWVPYFDIAIEMVQCGLGICFVFGDQWKIDSNTTQMIPICDAYGEPVKRQVRMLLSDQCYNSHEITDFISFIERKYDQNQI